jgi:hypothetical protein
VDAKAKPWHDDGEEAMGCDAISIR